VQITYDVETGGAIVKTELAFVMGIMADLSGDRPDSPALPELKDRKFIEIDRDNFDAILNSIQPRVANITLPPDPAAKPGDPPKKKQVDLTFQCLDDFLPLYRKPPDEQGNTYGGLIMKIDALKQLFTARQKLNDLLTKSDGNDKLQALLVKLEGDKAQQDAITALKPPDPPAATNGGK
jgi:type VI secretion system protein ImpB